MAETRLQVVYNITTTADTRLYKVTGNFSNIELSDGTIIPTGQTTYSFPVTGLTTVYYTLTGDTLVDELFSGVRKIVSVTVPSPVSTIGASCFRKCGLSAITLPDTLTEVGNYAFEYSSALTEITIYAASAPTYYNMTFSGIHTGGTFYYVKGSDYSDWFRDIDPSANVYANLGDYNWYQVYLTDDLVWTAAYDVITTASATPILACNKQISWYSGVVTDIRYNGQSIMNDLEVDVMSDCMHYGNNCNKGKPVVGYKFPSTGPQSLELVINEGKLMGYSDKSLSPMPTYVNDADGTLFSGTLSLVDITIPSGVTAIPKYCFRNCIKLSAVTLSPDMIEIPYEAFQNTNFNCFIIPDFIQSAACPCSILPGDRNNKPWIVDLKYLTVGTGVTYLEFLPYGYKDIATIYSKPTTCPTVVYPNGSFPSSGVNIYYPAGSNYSTSEWWPAVSPPDFRFKPLAAFPEDTCDKMPEPTGGTFFNPSGASVGSGSTAVTTTYSGACPIIFDHSATTGTWNTEPSLFSGGWQSDWWLSVNLTENDTESARTVTYFFNRYTGQNCDEFVETVDFSIEQAAGSGSTPPTPGEPNIYLDGSTYMTLASGGSCNSLPIVPVNCEYDRFTASIKYNPNLTAHSIATVTEENGNIKFCLTSNPNTAYTEVAIITLNLYDTSGNTYLYYCALDQYGNTGPQPPIPSGETIDSGSTSHTITYSGCPLVFDHSASTGTWNTLPTVTTAGTTDNWSLTYDVPANDTDSARTITYYYLRYSGETCEDLVDTVSYAISQNAGSGSTPGTTPDPWSDTGDTAYTWYKDDSLLRVLPSSRVLSYDEETAYWSVTARTFDNVGVRASGDVVFNYELIADGSAEYNSHSLYAHTQNNTGTTQQVSTIKLVAFSGSSAYSASTVLMKNPDSHGWITASPNPVNGASSQNSVNVYLTLTNCERNISKETTDNAEFDAATWVSVSRVNNTALTFNFQANNSNQARSTYYYAYGLDSSGNNVYCRIDITQEANSMGITITPDRTSLGKPAGSFTARVESTESGNFSFSAASWMVVRSYVPESQKAGTLYVDYYENTGNYTRVGDITVSQQISTAPYILTARTQISQNSTADTAYIRVTPSSISVDRTAGVVEAQVSYAGLATVPALVQNEGNMSIVSYNLESGLITIAYGANDTSMDKYKNFTVTAMSSNGNVIEANFTITQGGTGLPVAPIWRDYVITVPTPGQGYINYNINYDGAVVYTGRAYGMGQDNIEIYYNHLCKPFLSNHIDFTEGYQSIRDWLGNFIITSPELGDITSVSFYEDYSYVNRDITNVMSLNNPIINEVVEGSYVPFSFFITGTSGNVSIMQNGQQITGLTVNDNEQHRYFVEAEKGKTYSSLGAVYKTIPVCSARYSLYYVNSYGGVDVLPFKGKSFKKTDNITRLNYSRSFRNNTLEFENVNYMNEMKPAWELNTSYMVDSQSRKMHELVESTCVYLYDAEEQTYTPVVMTDKKLEYKTFYNQGRRFYTYTINVEESQSKERR